MSTLGNRRAERDSGLRVSNVPGVVVRIYPSIGNSAIDIRRRSRRVESDPYLFDGNVALGVGVLYDRRNLRRRIIGQSTCTCTSYV